MIERLLWVSISSHPKYWMEMVLKPCQDRYCGFQSHLIQNTRWKWCWSHARIDFRTNLGLFKKNNEILHRQIGCTENKTLKSKKNLSFSRFDICFSEWPEKYPECGKSPQSPIDVKPEHLRDLTRKIRFENYDAPISFTVENNGHGGDCWTERVTHLD